jgi:hypothetical protein
MCVCVCVRACVCAWSKKCYFVLLLFLNAWLIFHNTTSIGRVAFRVVENMNLVFVAPHLYRECPTYYLLQYVVNLSPVFAQTKALSHWSNIGYNFRHCPNIQAAVRRDLNIQLKEIWRIPMRKNSYRNCYNCYSNKRNRNELNFYLNEISLQV